MSGSNDNLKSMFQEAFAAEQIPVDMGAWSQMETLLDKRKPFGFAYWIWVPAIFILAGMTSWLALTSFQEEIYLPRNADFSFEPMHIASGCGPDQLWSDTFQSQTDLDSKETAAFKNSMESIGNKKSPSQAINSIPTKNQRITSSENEKSAITTHINDQPSVVNTSFRIDNGLQDVASGPMPVELIESDEDKPLMVIDDPDHVSNQGRGIETSVPSRLKTNLAKMPLAVLSRFDSLQMLSNPKTNPMVSKMEFIPSVYIKAGIHKSFNGFDPYSGYGQSIGLGYMKQVKHHLILSAELNGTRHRTGDTANISGETAYGFKRFQNEYIVTTTELIRFNTTLMAHYRMQRLHLGGGLQPWILGALKNSTEQRVENTEASTPVEITEGYYQWNRYKRVGMNAVADAQYQIFDDTFIGLRGSYGITDALAVDYKTLRLLEIQAYLKLNIR